jgi:hypothetical protein
VDQPDTMILQRAGDDEFDTLPMELMEVALQH